MTRVTIRIEEGPVPGLGPVSEITVRDDSTATALARALAAVMPRVQGEVSGLIRQLRAVRAATGPAPSGRGAPPGPPPGGGLRFSPGVLAAARPVQVRLTPMSQASVDAMVAGVGRLAAGMASVAEGLRAAGLRGARVRPADGSRVA